MRLENLQEQIRQEFEPVRMMKYFEHTQRLVGYVQEIIKFYDVNQEIMLAAGWIHDIGRVVDNSFAGHVNELEKKAMPILLKAGYSTDESNKIIGIAIKHHPKSDEELHSIEEQIIYDADNLELVGGIGLLRWFGAIPEKTKYLGSSAKMFMDMYESSLQKRGSLFYTNPAKMIGGVRSNENYEICKSIYNEVNNIYLNHSYDMALNTLFTREKSDNNQRNIVILAGLRCSGKTFVRKLILNYFDFDFYHTNRVKTGDLDSMTIGPKEIVKRYGMGESYFYFLKDDIINFYNSSNKTMIIDSVKCINDIKVIEEFFPNSKIYVLWMQAKDSLRLERYKKRDIECGIRNSNLFDHDKELIDLGILELVRNADFVVNTDDTRSNILHQISTFLIPLR